MNNENFDQKIYYVKLLNKLISKSITEKFNDKIDLTIKNANY